MSSHYRFISVEADESWNDLVESSGEHLITGYSTRYAADGRQKAGLGPLHEGGGQ